MLPHTHTHSPGMRPIGSASSLSHRAPSSSISSRRKQLHVVQSSRMPWDGRMDGHGWGAKKSEDTSTHQQKSASANNASHHRMHPLLQSRQAAMSCITFSSLASASGCGSGGGKGGGNGGGGGEGKGGWGGGDGGALPGRGKAPASNVLGDVALNEAPDMVEEVILIDVGGMKCGGCVGHVKKVLEEQESVTEASVNLATETALVRVLVPKGSQPQEVKAIGEKLAEVVSQERGFAAELKA